MIQSPAGYQGDVRIKRYLDFYQAGYGVAMLSSGTTAFTPASLFAASEPGGWYDPSDLTTLYQDAAGTTPVTAVEQPVGLVLDKSKGLVLGAELVTNGDFSNGTTGWESGSSNTTLTVVSGEAKSEVTTATSAALLYRPVAFSTSNVLYKVEFDVYSPNYSGAIRCSLNDSLAADAFSFTATVTATKTKVTSYLRAGPTPKLYITSTPSALSLGSIVYFDNVSVKQVQGSHLSQSTAAARPVLSARVNLLTQTEAFDVGPWVKSGLVTAGMANVTTAPDGTQTADQFVETAASGTHIVYVSASGTKADTISVAAKANTRSVVTIGCNDNSSGNWAAAAFNLSAGTAATAQAGGTFSGASSITSLGNGWYRCTLSVTSSGNAVAQVKYGVANSATPTFGSWADYSYTGDGTSGIYIWGADLRPANAGVGLPSYQRVGAATDYDTTGFPLYLKFDGTDDSLSSAAINFTSTDKMSVFAGVRKLSVDVGIIYELSGNWNTNDGSFQSASTNPGFDAASRGTAAVSGVTQVASVVAAVPATAVLTASHDIAGDLTAHRLNGAAAVNATGDKGSGNFGNYPFYVGNRFNNPPTTPSSLRFNGHLYSLIVRGAATDAATITATETWVNGKTMAY